MKKKLFCLSLVLMLVASVFFTGCTPKDTSTPGGDATDEPILIGAIASLSGVLMDYGNQMQRGFGLGLEYATNGTNQVAGRDIKVIWEDDQTNPDVAVERTIKLYGQDEVDILVGFTASGNALAAMGLAEEYERILIVEPAVADGVTGPDSNRYVFRTGRNSTQDALATAAVVLSGGGDVKVATFAQDTAFGRSGVAPFIKNVVDGGGTIVEEIYAGEDVIDFTTHIQRIRNSGADYTFVVWAGENDPWTQFGQQNLADYTTFITGAPQLDALRNMQHLDGAAGFTVYYNEVAQNPVNEWLVTRHLEEFGTVPDIFTSGGMAAAIAVVTAIEKTNGSVEAEDLIQAMRGMEFDSPTGKRFFRKEDHQAMQSLFEIKLESREGYDHIVPTLVRVIPWQEIEPPITVVHD